MRDAEELTITLPGAITAALRVAVARGGYGSEVELIADMVGDWLSHPADDDLGYSVEELRALIQEGLDSGPGIPAEQVFAELRSRFRVAT